MKKLLILSAAVILVSAVKAQVKYGVKAGANLAMWNGSDASDAKSKIGFNAGGLVNIPVSEMFSVQPEVLFSAEGAKFSEGSDDIKYNLGFVNIPVLFQYNNASGFYAETGPQLGLLVTAKAKAGGESADVKDSFKGTNFSWTVGAGFKTSMGVGVGARYAFGLANIVDESGVDIKQSNVSLGLFYQFGGNQ